MALSSLGLFFLAFIFPCHFYSEFRCFFLFNPWAGKEQLCRCSENLHGVHSLPETKHLIPADADIHLQLANNEGAYNHPCVVAEQNGPVSTVYPITSRRGRPMTDAVFDYRNRYRLIDHPGASTHDGNPILRLRQGTMCKLSHVNISDRLTIFTAHLAPFEKLGKDELALDTISVNVLKQEAKAYETRQTVKQVSTKPEKKPTMSSWRPLSTITGNATTAKAMSIPVNKDSASTAFPGYPQFANPEDDQENVDPNQQQRPPNAKATRRRVELTATPTVSTSSSSRNRFSNARNVLVHRHSASAWDVLRMDRWITSLHSSGKGQGFGVDNAIVAEDNDVWPSRCPGANGKQAEDGGDQSTETFSFQPVAPKPKSPSPSLQQPQASEQKNHNTAGNGEDARNNTDKWDDVGETANAGETNEGKQW
ncbi:MAG: hypothetical protein Q9157_007106 [Trypethelium eluteriae]